MGKHCFVVLTTPFPGKDDEFNAWYTEQHLPDVLRFPGFVSAQRFKLPEDSTLPGRYLALYQMETDNPEACIENLVSHAGTPELALSSAMDMDKTSTTLCALIAERTKA